MGFISSGYLHSQYEAPQPNCTKGYPSLFMNCPTRLNSSETNHIILWSLCDELLKKSKEQSHSFLFSQKGHLIYKCSAELKNLQLYGIFIDQIHKNQVHILIYFL